MSTTDVTPAAPLSPLPVPKLSITPLRLMEAVPWLMLASAIRFVAYGNKLLALATVMADLSLFLAFLLAAHRMIEFADGGTRLGWLSFHEQIELGWRVVHRVVLLLIVAALAFYVLGAREIAPYLMLGFDGIAFDQFTKTGMIWSAALAVIVLLMVVQAGLNRSVTLSGALRQLWQCSACLLPAIVAVAVFQFGLSFVQAFARSGVHLFWMTSGAPPIVKNFVYFAFVFSFASLRLWVTLAILTFALRESYRRSATPATAPTAPNPGR
jgi:hypothetical protein